MWQNFLSNKINIEYNTNFIYNVDKQKGKIMVNLEELENIVDAIKILFIIIFTYFIELKIINEKISIKKEVRFFIEIVILAIASKIIKNRIGYVYCIILMIMVLGEIFSKRSKNNIGYSIIITTISLSISYILFFIAIALSYIPNAIFEINNNFDSLLIIIIIYSLLMIGLLKTKRINKGISFLKNNLKNEYIDILTLNISMIILLGIVLLSNTNVFTARTFGFSMVIFSIIMFITIQKSLQLYYKQKLQQRELEETKEELKKKEEKIKQLEQENLNYSKTSHSIAHRQKTLEYKLNQLLLKNETANEIGIKDRINKISKEISSKTTEIELRKTGIQEIDDMLEYMKSECIKNNIDFELQIKGNIHHMTNKYISKEDLEIVLADHIKNAIIAINYSENINKSIYVKLGIIDGLYGVYIYDSGIEFKKETLFNLGKKPSTTHAESGGTGIGFMNTFDTLNKYKASIEINEYGKPCKDNYTKYIAIKFDNNNEYKIISYRSEELKEWNNKNDKNIEIKTFPIILNLSQNYSKIESI